MKYLEVHNVEYGECVVLGGSKREILMVDCGSMNRKIREGDVEFTDYVYGGIMGRYAALDSRAFLLTHCHRDHVCGFWQILNTDPGYFGRIYLPAAPCGECGRPLLLEFAVYVFAFLNRLTGYSKANAGELRLFIRAARAAGPERVYPVRAGDSFRFDGAEYDVLWPRPEGYPFSASLRELVEKADRLLSSPFLPADAEDFLLLKRRFCSAYLSCCGRSPLAREDVEELELLCGRLEDLIPRLLLLPVAREVVETLASPAAQDVYSDSLNAASVIFQNRREGGEGPDDILMTGDAPPQSLDAVESRLYDGYYILKAPHHGTAGAWSPLFPEIAAAHVVISNGDYRSGGGIASAWADLPGVKHCTNRSACARFRESGCSCCRFSCCWEQPGRPGALTVKCPAHRPGAAPPPCNIRVVSPLGGRACLCDLPPEKNGGFGGIK